MIDTKLAIDTAKGMLDKKTFGGVTTDSAEKAIAEAANAVKKQADADAEAAEKALSDAQAAAGKAKVDLDNAKKDNETLTASNKKLTEDNAALTEALNEATATKVSKPRKLPNGNLKTTKINSNGARGTLETLADGKTVVSYSVETLNGDYVKITVDPTTHKLVKKFTRYIMDDGDVKENLTEYTPNGHKITRINPKKSQTIPTSVSITEVNENHGFKERTFKEVFSDGSYKLTTFSERDSKNPVKILSYDSKERLTEQYQEKIISNGGKLERITTKYDPETGNKTNRHTVNYFVNNGELELSNTVDSKYDDTQEIERTKTLPDGTKQIIKAEKNEFGMYNVNNPSMEYIYPKSSPIKKSKTIFNSQFSPVKEEILMKNGVKVTTKVNGGWYYTTELKETQPNGEEKVVKDIEECSKYLKNIGYCKEKFGDKYYHNLLDKNSYD